MDPACLQHKLTDVEKKTFEEDGYLYVPNALDPDHVSELERAVDRTYARHLARGQDPRQPLVLNNFVPDDYLYQDLVDYDRILPKVWGILGWNIYLFHCHLGVTPRTCDEPVHTTYAFHQDSGRVNAEMEGTPRPRLSVKVAYMLSPTVEPGQGNLWVVPGSHLLDKLDMPADGQGQPEGAIPVCVEPGTAVLFDRRLYHAASPNWSDVTRKVLFYGYAYRWTRPKNAMTVEHLWEQADPIRRQMYGARVTGNGSYGPSDEDVPLRAWLKEHDPQSVAQ